MTVNVSSRQLMQTDFVDQVASAIRDVELSPDGLQLEITETALMENRRRRRRRSVGFLRWVCDCIWTTLKRGTRH